ncbi:hypothetical protein [Ferrimonas kyonanensis]|uniref:hypothetical protein n=1 Tax=Ferrimonas kyonanensis TaxID=364763 RepID=UPI0012EC2B20|nr:hypothetical protein [Ferrimonas kyonanensis]
MKKLISSFIVFFLMALTTSAQAGITDSQICKAGIGADMGRSPSTMLTERVVRNDYFISYRRPDDNSWWGYKCKVKGGQVIWASWNDDDSVGRWRDTQWDRAIYYVINEQKINIRLNGTSEIMTYDANNIPQ